jgi:hypothetical protein
MITHEELAQRLRVAYEGWLDISNDKEDAWLAAAELAWDLVEGENAIWAEAASRKEEALRELVVEFMNRAEDVIG